MESGRAKVEGWAGGRDTPGDTKDIGFLSYPIVF